MKVWVGGCMSGPVIGSVVCTVRLHVFFRYPLPITPSPPPPPITPSPPSHPHHHHALTTTITPSPKIITPSPPPSHPHHHHHTLTTIPLRTIVIITLPPPLADSDPRRSGFFGREPNDQARHAHGGREGVCVCVCVCVCARGVGSCREQQSFVSEFVMR